MRPTVYIDVLFLINLIINLILLYATALLMSIKIKKARFFLASLFGALYSVFIFFPDFNIFYSGGAKFLSSLAILAIAFNIKGVRLYLKTLGVFYIVTLIFGGGAFAVFCFSGVGAKTGAIIKNGVLYFNFPWKLLFISAAASYMFISAIYKTVLNRTYKGERYVRIHIEYMGESAEFTALLDTGNSLREPISHSPVIVAELEKIKKILPPEIALAAKSGNLNFETGSSLLQKIRVIPFSSIGRESGILIGFRPSRVWATVNEHNVEIENVIVGISPLSLSSDKRFQALINPAVIS